MMENDKIQEKEIEDVAGGASVADRVPASYKMKCPSCGQVFEANEFDLVNRSVELISRGCGKKAIYRYTCPYCKHTWDE